MTTRSSTPPPVDPQSWIGHVVTDPQARPLGRLAAVYTDNATGLPAWAVVDDGAGTALVPLDQARHDGTSLRVPYDAQQLRHSPHRNHSGHLDADQGAQLRHHYTSSVPGSAAAPNQDHDDTRTAMTRHEERLRVSTQVVATGRVRVRKRLVTENQTITVPVTREEITIEHEEAPRATLAPATGQRLTEETIELVRHEERIVATTEVVPVERVRIVRHIVTAPQVIEGAVRAEVLEISEEPTAGR